MNWFNKDVEEVSKILKTDLEKGISSEEAKKKNRRKRI